MHQKGIFMFMKLWELASPYPTLLASPYPTLLAWLDSMLARMGFATLDELFESLDHAPLTESRVDLVPGAHGYHAILVRHPVWDTIGPTACPWSTLPTACPRSTLPTLILQQR